MLLMYWWVSHVVWNHQRISYPLVVRVSQWHYHVAISREKGFEQSLLDMSLWNRVPVVKQRFVFVFQKGVKFEYGTTWSTIICSIIFNSNYQYCEKFTNKRTKSYIKVMLTSLITLYLGGITIFRYFKLINWKIMPSCYTYVHVQLTAQFNVTYYIHCHIQDTTATK